MNILIHIVITFIFVFVLLMLNIPHLQQDAFLKYKLYIFTGVFIFEFCVGIFTAIYKKCIINIGLIVRESLQSALIATLAYGIFNDLVWSSSPLIRGTNTKFKRNLYMTVVITLFVTLGYFFDIVLSSVSPKANDCLNTVYGKANTKSN